MLRVLLDATALPAERGGVGRYVDNLVPALVRAGVDVDVACQPHDAEFFASLTGRTKVAGALARRAVTRLPWEQTALPLAIRQIRPDVVHSPHYTQPLAVRCPLVVTLHDATFFTAGHLHGPVKRSFFRGATRVALHRAKTCIVPSQATADELQRVAGADPAKLVVAHHGVDSSVFAPPSPAHVAAFRSELGLRVGERYVCFLGTMEPRKNVPALIRAWVAACRDRVDAPALVLAGRPGWDAALDAAVQEVPDSLRLIRTGYLPLTSLSALLGGADLVAYPSFGEGFGLPVLEAMACGAAVLTTRRLSLPEVGGSAVEYCDVDVASITNGLRRLLDDRTRTAALGRAARERAATFRWDASAADHIKAYEQALAGCPRPTR
ncbi:MAG TPA: glycosyltransferase family 1 protein [Jatrophihabitantaceae bacterium]|nr:glycosyltransferase family 1 protein [Jatrophihabitantaceae bacterium]